MIIKTHISDLIPTAGGTLLSTLASVGLTNLAGTVILAFVGALASYVSTQIIKWVHKTALESFKAKRPK